jgi:hypothetical protein
MVGNPMSRRFRHDVFISYTHVDNELEAGRHWVTQFHRDLEGRLRRLSGRRDLNVWRDERGRLDSSALVDDTIQDALSNTAVFVAILSPVYLLQSPYCTKERNYFLQVLAEQGGAGMSNRIVKVAKTPIRDLSLYPPEFRATGIEHQFFDPATELEFDISAPDIRYRHFSALNDVAKEIADLLGRLEHRGGASRPTIFLAETSSDFAEERRKLRREFETRFEILPSRDLRLLSGPEVVDSVKEDLRRSQLSVHPIGEHYGLIPELSDRSLVDLQLETAVTHGSGIPRLVWLPPGITPRDDRQRALVEQIKREFSNMPGVEVLERQIESVKAEIDRKLSVTPPSPSSADETLNVYLMCDDRDRKSAECLRRIRRQLYDHGFEVHWPPSEVSAESFAKLHREYLTSDDAFLIFYGDTDEAWVQGQLRELLKARGLRRNRPIRAQAVFLAGPPSVDKDDFLTRHALLIGRPGECTPESLGPFLKEFGK